MKMTTSIYDLHDKAFGQVQAYVVAKDDDTATTQRVATIAFKMPPAGHGERRLWAYVHWLGEPMVRGFAGGYGYDKRSAAAASAAGKLTNPQEIRLSEHAAEQGAAWQAFRDALANDDGKGWSTRLERAGFTVWQAV